MNLKCSFYYSLFTIFLLLYYFSVYNKSKKCKIIGATASSDNHAYYASDVIYSFSLNNPDCLLFFYNLNLNEHNYYKLLLDVYITNKYIEKQRYEGKVYFLNYTQNIYSSEFAISSMSFKPSIVYKLLKKYHSTVIWMDAGTEILRPLTSEIDHANKYGFYMDRNKHILLDWAHPSAIKYFNFSKNQFVGLPDTEAGYLTVSYNVDFIKKVIKPWYECSKHRECISPKNFSRKYYRRDQPALSMLIYNSSPYSKYVGIEQIKDSHLRQCDHKKGCNIHSNYIKIIKSIS